jgi:hypothetical protein
MRISGVAYVKVDSLVVDVSSELIIVKIIHAHRMVFAQVKLILTNVHAILVMEV